MLKLKKSLYESHICIKRGNQGGLMDYDSITAFFDRIPALEWVMAILLTGFIAQFGKMLAEYIIEKAKKRRNIEKEPVRPEKDSGNGSAHAAEIQKKIIKADKKAIKAEQKKAKKSG